MLSLHFRKKQVFQILKKVVRQKRRTNHCQGMTILAGCTFVKKGVSDLPLRHLVNGKLVHGKDGTIDRKGAY